jgi:hypothetical protein
MSLDERVRAGLRNSAAAGGLDADAVLRGVVSTHRRARLLGRVVRQATAVAVVLTLFVGVAIFVSWRNAPLRYRSVATVRFATLPGVKLSDPRSVALAPSTRRATLLAAHLAPDNTEVQFRATSAGDARLSLAVTAASRQESVIVAERWASTLGSARKTQARNRLIEARRNMARRVAALHTQLQGIDGQLAKLDPKVYGTLWKYDAPLGLRAPTALGQPNSPPPVPERSTVHELNLAFERIQLISQLQKYGLEAAGERFGALSPNVITLQIHQTAPRRVDATPSAVVPATAVWVAGLALIAAAAFVFYRRRRRAPLRT